MGKQVTIGGARLGSGKRMQTNLKSYERSTHNLGYLWRSTMAPGTLIPFMVEPALPGDTWDIGLASEVLTLPTIGPLFGSFKLQLDVFQVPIRLYQAQLHNNKLYIGMNMEDINLPQIELEAKPVDFNNDINVELQHINPSALLSYLGIKGLGKGTTPTIVREFDATPLLAYWDIYKNYYANKMEEIGVFIHTNTNEPTITSITDSDNILLSAVTDNRTIDDPITLQASDEFKIVGTNFNLINLSSILVHIVQGGGTYEFPITGMFETVVLTDATHITCTNPLFGMTGGSWSEVFYPDLVDDTIYLKQFDLSNIDTMREDILAAIKTTTPFMVSGVNYSPYIDICSKLADDTLQSKYVLEGIGIKTYQSDIFNNWLNTEWIDGVSGINAITSIDTTGNKFSLDTLNLAKKVYSLLNDIAVSGGSYEDWIEATYDIESMRKAETPMYEGGLSREIVFNEVVSNSASQQTLDNSIEPLGTLGGRGVMGKKNKGGKLVIKVSEPSYIIGIVSITPRIDYSQGNRWYTNLKTMNDFHKPALDQIGFQDLITDQMAFWDTDIDGVGVVTFKSAGKQPSWINYQTNFNRTYGNFADPNKEMFMTLNRRYEHDGFNGIKDLTTYIDPSKFNYAFASTNLDSQNFWTHIAVDAEVRRKMSAKIMPNV